MDDDLENCILELENYLLDNFYDNDNFAKILREIKQKIGELRKMLSKSVLISRLKMVL